MDKNAYALLVSCRNRPLRHYGSIMPFIELPSELQEIIRTGNVGVHVELPFKITPCNVNSVTVNLESLSFWYGEIPTEVLKDLVFRDDHKCCESHRRECFRTFDERHKAFMECAKARMPRFTCKKYPVALRRKEENITFEDGYGRFHRYVEWGMSMIPALAGVGC